MADKSTEERSDQNLSIRERGAEDDKQGVRSCNALECVVFYRELWHNNDLFADPLDLTMVEARFMIRGYLVEHHLTFTQR